MSQDTTSTYVPAHKDARPIRYENLRPGSYFTIFAEPSRRIRRSTDKRVYWRVEEKAGFFSMHPVTGQGVVLMPNDLVVPMRKVPYAEKK